MAASESLLKKQTQQELVKTLATEAAVAALAMQQERVYKQVYKETISPSKDEVPLPLPPSAPNETPTNDIIEDDEYYSNLT